MSTKIYDGYRLPLDQLPTFVPTANEALIEAAGQDYLNLYVSVLLNILKNNDTVQYHNQMNLDRYDSIWMKTRQAVDIVLNGGFSVYKGWYAVCFYGTEWCYLICFFGSKNTQKAWEQLVEDTGLEFYGYWNNTDPQKGISKREWKSRGKVWEKVLPGYRPISRAGMLFDIYESDEMLKTEWAENEKVLAHPDAQAAGLTAEDLRRFVRNEP